MADRSTRGFYSSNAEPEKDVDPDESLSEIAAAIAALYSKKPPLSYGGVPPPLPWTLPF